MGEITKDKVEIIKDFFNNHPEAAEEFIKENPGVLEWLSKNAFNQSQANSQSLQSGNSVGSNTYSKQLTKSIPGVPKMFNWDENGISNYITLAFLAFLIQLAVTIICIIFYK